MSILIIKNGECEISINTLINNFINTKIKFNIIKSYNFKSNNIEELVKKYNGIIILGGHQSMTELDKFPYLLDVIKLIKYSVESNIPILGICLGCQMIGKAFGCEIIKMHKSEIGYHSFVDMTNVGKKDILFGKYIM